MTRIDPIAPSRRGFLGLVAGLGAAASIPIRSARAEDEPTIGPEGPRAISGDPVEPDWAERLTLTVGQSDADADIVGRSEKAIQAALDAVARLGGGTVRILPGTYRLRNSVYLPSNVRLVGSGADSVLVKEPSHTAKLVADSDWYDREITLADADGFRVGDGVCLRATNPHHGGAVVVKRTLVARSGNRFKLDRSLRDNLWLAGEPTASTLFPMISGENIADVVIEDLTIDGNLAANAMLDGNYSGCIFLQDCNRVAIRRVTARNNHGDGISWQICHDVTVEDCHSHDNFGLGLHPGSGSQRPVMRNNTIERNDLGIFFCWGVRHGLAEANTIRDNRSYGVSIGHRDTDNLVRGNTIRNSGKVGVLFRDERRAFAGHRNRIEANTIEDSGGEAGVGVDVQGETEGVTIAGNTIVETRSPAQRVGIRIGPKTRAIAVEGNKVDGFAEAVVTVARD